MDAATAKTLVSLALVISIAAFSVVSISMLVRQVAGDLRHAWAKRAATAEHRG